MGQLIKLLGAALQSVPVFQIRVVAFWDPLGAIEKTPAAAGDHCSAVAITWAGRQNHRDTCMSRSLMIKLIYDLLEINLLAFKAAICWQSIFSR